MHHGFMDGFIMDLNSQILHPYFDIKTKWIPISPDPFILVLLRQKSLIHRIFCWRWRFLSRSLPHKNLQPFFSSWGVFIEFHGEKLYRQGNYSLVITSVNDRDIQWDELDLKIPLC